MLKLTYILILAILFTVARAQPQREPVYKYSYHIAVPISACNASIVQDSARVDAQQPVVEIEIKDCNNSVIPSASISLKRKGAQGIHITTDEKGIASSSLTEGEYVLKIKTKNAAEFIQTISLAQYQQRHLHIMLQSKPVKQHYTIQAKVWLLQAEVNMIKQCIIDNKGDASKCGRKLYRVMTDI